ncbi:MAG: DUF2292 domain-containing protein, partial [Clostridia bacterium]|nr:DUF2292 domain-containing protein [Clostridia bacterium]
MEAFEMEISEKKDMQIDACLEQVKKILRGVEYGTVTIIVQNGV